MKSCGPEFKKIKSRHPEIKKKNPSSRKGQSQNPELKYT